MDSMHIFRRADFWDASKPLHDSFSATTVAVLLVCSAVLQPLISCGPLSPGHKWEQMLWFCSSFAAAYWAPPVQLYLQDYKFSWRFWDDNLLVFCLFKDINHVLLFLELYLVFRPNILSISFKFFLKPSELFAHLCTGSGDVNGQVVAPYCCFIFENSPDSLSQRC